MEITSNDRRINLEKAFETDRIKLRLTTLLLLPYVPLGIFLAILRTCLLLNFLIARTLLRLFLDGDSYILRNITRLFMVILGIYVQLRGRRLSVDVLACNRRSSIDRFIICHLLNVFAEDLWNLPGHLLPHLQLCTKERLRRAGKSHPKIVFPEKYPTSGQFITQFDEQCFQNTKSVQPAAIAYWRPLPISVSTIHSSALNDLFWMFFNPFNIAEVSLSAESISCTDISGKGFSSAAMEAVSKLSGQPILRIPHDKVLQYLESPLSDIDTPPHILRMAKKVEEIVPHVPRNVIVADLKKTSSVDVTLTNIFEGIVDFVPIDITSQSSRMPENINRHQTPLENRKAELMETARRRYKEKHGL